MTRRTTAIVIAAALAPLLAGCASPKSERTDYSELRPIERELIALEFAEQAESARLDGETDEALRLYAESIRAYPNVAVVRNNFGIELLNQGETLAAGRQFAAAADLEPTDPRHLTNLGITYARLNWPKDAMRYFERALEVDPDDLGALRGAIQAAEFLGRADEVELERIKNATLRETDPVWSKYFQRQRFRIENQIRLRERDDNDPQA